MFSLDGKFNTCKVFTDNCDNATISQIMNILNQESSKDSVIRIMPDCHAGKGAVIGTTMTLKDKVIPYLVGSDIGCGMSILKVKGKVELEKLDKFIHQNIPSGAKIHNRAIAKFDELKDIVCPINIDSANKYIGTLGGGNHFIELDKDSNGDVYLVVHTGSRKLGMVVCEHYQKTAYEELKAKRNGGYLKDLIKDLEDKESNKKELSAKISKLKVEYNRPFEVPFELAYLEGEDFKNYIHDIDIIQRYAELNRQIIIREICREMKWKEVDGFSTIHNYIDVSNMILRKGAISANEKERVIIPMNMRDGSLICIGKGNSDWNYSAPHGAGRLMPRSEAKESISMKDFKDSMKGIYTSCVSTSTIDESPMAYKPMEEIIKNIEETAHIIDIIKPIYNFKAGRED